MRLTDGPWTDTVPRGAALDWCCSVGDQSARAVCCMLAPARLASAAFACWEPLLVSCATWLAPEPGQARARRS